MSKIFFLLSLASILTACGNGNNDQQAVVSAYGSNAALTCSGGGGQDVQFRRRGFRGDDACPAQVAMDWNALVASRCGSRNGQPVNDACSQGVEVFRRCNAAYIQGPGCAVAVAQMQWCPGNMQGQDTFQINEGVLNAISTQNGPGSWPVNGGQVMPGQVGMGNGF